MKDTIDKLNNFIVKTTRNKYIKTHKNHINTPAKPIIYWPSAESGKKDNLLYGYSMYNVHTNIITT